MKLPSISYDPISKLIDLLVDAGIDKIKEKADRSAKVIAIRKQLNLGADKPLADDFDGVYAFTLAKYYEGDYPKAILEFFGDSIIKDAFQRSFEQRNYGILEGETENFLDWNNLGKRFQTLDIQPQTQFDGFQQLFYESIELTKLPKDVIQDHNLSDLDNRVTSLEDEVQEIKEVKEQVLPPPFNLPSIDISKFTGRDAELAKLEELIFNQQGSRVVGIVGLTGTGGMGKSALAVYFAYKYKDRFPDGVIGMRVDRATTDEVARSFALQVVTKVDPELKVSQIMQRYFQNRRALLILDNVEDATARELEPGGDKCAVIITTRNRNLNLGTTGQIDLNRFSPKETHDLLVSFLGEQRVSAESDAVQRIHILVGGLPLAIRIVGGALVDEKETTMNEFADRLENERNRLYLNDPYDESLDVHASINVSLRKLDETQIYLYSCLSVCAPEGFSSETVKAISQRETDVVKTNLARLVKLSLLDFSEEKRRYLLHPLLFDATNELANGNNKEIKSENIYKELLGNHITYFRGFAIQNKGLLFRNLNAIEGEIDELLLTAKRLIEKKNADYGFYLALEPFFQNRGYWAQAMGIIDAYLKIAKENQDWESVTQLHIQHAQFLTNAGKFSQAEQSLNNARQELKNVKSEQQASHLSAMILNSLGGIYQKQGSFKEAVDTLGQSYELLVKLNDESGQAKALNSLGGALQRQGKFDEASDAFYKCAEIEERLGNERGQAMVLNSLGGVLQRKGNFDKAADAFQKSAAIEERLGNERGQAMVLNSLGGVKQRQGDFQGAVDNIQKSYNILVSIGDERGQAMVLNSLGGVYQRQGKFDEAVTAFQKSAAIGEKIEDFRHLAMVLNSLGGVLQRQGKFDEAVTAFQKSAIIEEKLKNDRGQAMVLNSLGGVLQRQGKFDEAVTAFQKSYELLVKLEDDRGQAMVLNSLGGVLSKQGKYIESENAFKSSITIGKRLRDKSHLSKVHTAFGKSLLAQNKHQDALIELKEGFEIDEALHNKFGMRIVTPALVNTLVALGNKPEAIKICNRALSVSPKDNQLLHIQRQLLEKDNAVQKSGHIKKLLKHEKGYLYGFIETDDKTPDIYFNERQVDRDLLPLLKEGVNVIVEVDINEQTPRTKRVLLKTN